MLQVTISATANSTCRQTDGEKRKTPTVSDEIMYDCSNRYFIKNGIVCVAEIPAPKTDKL